MDSNCNRFQELCYDQVKKLDSIFTEPLAIKGRGHFGCLTVCLKDLVPRVVQQLAQFDIPVTDVRLNGGAASYVMHDSRGPTDSERDYGDLDLIFGIDVAETHESLQRIREAVIELIRLMLHEGDEAYELTSDMVMEAYVQKMVKVCTDRDCWNLLSLGYIHDPVEDINVELKFVSKMNRQFEFSVDSFQVILDSLLSFYESSTSEMDSELFPTVIAESVYGDISAALTHLQEKVIATRNPEQIRGGGLLKYCYLRSKGYRSANEKEDMQLQRYMCSRFFIDFKDIMQQKARLDSYLLMHFGPEKYGLKVDYLKILHCVIRKSTVCLMGHEHQQILDLLVSMIRYFELQEKHKANLQEMYSSQFDWQCQNHLVIDQVFYGYCYEQSSDCSSSRSTSPLPWTQGYPSQSPSSSSPQPRPRLCPSPNSRGSMRSGCSPRSCLSPFSPASSPNSWYGSPCSSPVQYTRN